MNIQIITSSYPGYPDDPSGTSGLFVRAFALELQKQGHLVVIQPVARKDHYTPDDGLIIAPLPWRGGNQELASLNMYSPFSWINVFAFFPGARHEVIQAHKQYEIDRTLCMWAMPSGLLGYLMKKAINKPYDVWALGSDIWRITKIPLLGNALLKIIISSADRVFADGHGLAQDVEKIAHRHCEFLPSSRTLPVPQSASKSPNNTKHINLLFVGRYHHRKGPDVLLHAFQMLPRQVKERLRLKMFGIGPLESSLIEYVETHHLEDFVTVNDGIGAEELAEELSQSSFLVIPSRIESIPVVFSDALQTGTPVIASPAGDLPSLIQEYGCGILADDYSPEALARAIEVACCGHKKEDFAKGTYEISRRFQVIDTAKKWLAFSLA